MEPSKAKVTLFLGDYPVEEVSANVIAVNIGNNVRILINPLLMAGRPSLKAGDKVPLYTEIPLCPPSTH